MRFKRDQRMRATAGGNIKRVLAEEPGRSPKDRSGTRKRRKILSSLS